MNNKAIQYIEESFLKDILQVEDLTDISYNGEFLFYESSSKGRKKSELAITQTQAYDFLRQIANFTDSQFSYSTPILDVTVDKYRINAVFCSIARNKKVGVYVFSIRLGFNGLRINQEDTKYCPKKVFNLLDNAIKNNISIVISGCAGSGKTELQKYLISRIEENKKVIVIDNINELELCEYQNSLDLQIWVGKDENESTQKLIKNALRVNPDWVILGEARGKEMINILTSSMSGHPTLTTVHVDDISSIYQRMARLCMQDNNSLVYSETLKDLQNAFKIVIYLEKEINTDGTVIRRIKEIGTNLNSEYVSIYKHPNKYANITTLKEFSKKIGLNRGVFDYE